MLSHDLTQHVDSTRRTIPKREAPWVEGFSVGGCVLCTSPCREWGAHDGQGPAT
jgi:hypothetical protein